MLKPTQQSKVADGTRWNPHQPHFTTSSTWLWAIEPIGLGQSIQCQTLQQSFINQLPRAWGHATQLHGCWLIGAWQSNVWLERKPQDLGGATELRGAELLAKPLSGSVFKRVITV